MRVSGKSQRNMLGKFVKNARFPMDQFAGLSLDAGGGTRTPDTRIMIPLAFPAFTGDLGLVGLFVGLFCQ
jgi:hypothetical protein